MYSINPAAAAAEHIASTIQDKLAGDHKVTWIISGSSGLAVVLQVAHALADINLANLSVTISDERYGDIGHQDENWQQLLDAGFTLPGAALYRPLIDKDRSETTRRFSDWLHQHITTADYSIGLFGIGTDGHTAGIKPYSSAVESTAWVDEFTGDDFNRITMTPLAISQLNEAVIQASGIEKNQVIRNLLHQSIDINEQPAQTLKLLPIVTLHSDNKDVQ